MLATQITNIPSPLGPVSWGQHNALKAPFFLKVQSASPRQPPAELPALIQGPCAWSGSDLKDQPIFQLSEEEVSEIESALTFFKNLELDGDEVSRDRFPLPQLEKRLDEACHEVHKGRSFCIIRGLDPARYSIEDNTVIFLGISAYMGDERGLQDSKGAMLSHVTEAKSWFNVPKANRHGIHTNASLPFHSDMGCEILALHVRDCAEEGGRTVIAPGATIFNDLARSNPNALRAMAKPTWPVQLARKDLYVKSPLIDFHAGNLIMAVDESRIGIRPSTPGVDGRTSVPQVTAEQQEALRVLQQTAQKHQLALDSRRGDLVYLNNLSLLHARESYRDGEKGARHLVRLWLRNSRFSWPIPQLMREPWETSFGERCKRIHSRLYPVAPMPEYEEPRYSNGTAAFVVDDAAGDKKDSDAARADIFYDDSELACASTGGWDSERGR